MRINDVHFHAEGDEAEVQAKFKKWLDDTFSPIKLHVETLRKVLDKKL